MANQIGDTVSKGNYFNVCTDETNQTFETKSFYTDSEDVSFADGVNAENKVGAIKGITSDFNTTDAGYAASMTAVSKLNSRLTDNFIIEQRVVLLEMAPSLTAFEVKDVLIDYTVPNGYKIFAVIPFETGAIHYNLKYFGFTAYTGTVTLFAKIQNVYNNKEQNNLGAVSVRVLLMKL